MGTPFHSMLFNVKIFNPLAKTSKTLPDTYKHHENLEKLKYQQRILDVEQRSVVPLIFSFTGGAAPGGTKVMQRLAEKIGKNIGIICRNHELHPNLSELCSPP